MERNELPMTEFNLSLFTFSRTSTGAIKATAEASTIGYRAPERMYADAADAGIAIKSPKTGLVERFYHLRTERDREGDVTVTVFQAVKSICPVELVYILND